VEAFFTLLGPPLKLGVVVFPLEEVQISVDFKLCEVVLIAEDAILMKVIELADSSQDEFTIRARRHPRCQNTARASDVPPKKIILLREVQDWAPSLRRAWTAFNFFCLSSARRSAARFRLASFTKSCWQVMQRFTWWASLGRTQRFFEQPGVVQSKSTV
jgi:hypothetical protein